MTGWRIHSLILYVSLLPISRAGAIEVSLSPSTVSWYFQFLETYVFPFILAASLALLIGYGLRRVLGSSLETPDRPPKTFDRLPEVKDPETKDKQLDSELLPESPVLHMPEANGAAVPELDAVDLADAPDRDESISFGFSDGNIVSSVKEPDADAPAPVFASDLDRSTEAVGSDAEEFAAPLDVSQSDAATLEEASEADSRNRPAMSSAELVDRIMGQADELAAVGDARFDVEKPDTTLAPAVKTELLLKRIADRAKEQARSSEESAAEEAHATPGGDEATADNQDFLFQRINADDVDSPADTSNGVADDAIPEAGADVSPADELDSLLQRIDMRSPDEPQAVPNGAGESVHAGLEPESSAAERLDFLIQRIGDRASGQPMQEKLSEVLDDGLSPADKLDALAERIGSSSAEQAPSEDGVAPQVEDEPVAGTPVKPTHTATDGT
jgi:hypothetical protein